MPDVPLICGADVRGYLMHLGFEGGRLRAIPWGMMIEEAGTKIRPVLPEIIRFKRLLADALQEHPDAPQPFILEPGEIFSI